LEKWVLGYWFGGLTAIIDLTMKLEMDSIQLLTNIPSFHCSIIP
jgi:hypothetical protein